MTPQQLFQAVGLSPSGPVRWREPVPEIGPGVYVVARVASADDTGDPIDAGVALAQERPARWWLPGEPVVYVGKAVCLRTRLAQFYRHRHGDPAPHRGGQDVLLLTCPPWVYWSRTAEPQAAERAMLRHFKAVSGGARPFGNRRG